MNRAGYFNHTAGVHTSIVAAMGLLAGLTLSTTSPAVAGECPADLDHALRLVMVTSSSMSTPIARLQLFARPTVKSPWRPVGQTHPAVIGKAGLGWGHQFGHLKRAGEPEKFEGDKKSPAGIYPIGTSFGFEQSRLRRHIVVRAGETVCVEDPTSAFYNRITTASMIERHVRPDEMRRTSLFRRGLFVEYPTDRAGRRGSCIFIHIWNSAREGTAGCIGLREDRVAELQAFSEPGAVLAVLPEFALRRIGSCLPQMPPRQ